MHLSPVCALGLHRQPRIRKVLRAPSMHPGALRREMQLAEALAQGDEERFRNLLKQQQQQHEEQQARGWSYEDEVGTEVLAVGRFQGLNPEL